MRSILVPVDGSPLSETAIPMAIAIARRLGAGRVEALVVAPSERTGGDPGSEAAAGDVSAAYVAKVQERLVREVSESSRAVVVEGSPAEAIVARVSGEQHDLIVMTTHGRSGVSRAWLGSVTDRVIRSCSCPVLVLRHDTAVPAEDPLFARVLIPIDFDGDGAEVMRDVRALVGDRAAIHLLHVVVPHLIAPSPSVFEAFEQAARSGGEVETMIRTHQHPAEAILEVAKEIGATLIAMTTHGRGGIGRAFMGSVSDKVVRGAAVPVLVRKPSEDAA